MKEHLGENEWRRRMILAARKVQQATQTFAEDVAAIRDVRPGVERLEKALNTSHQKLEKLEERLLEEVLRRLEERERRDPTSAKGQAEDQLTARRVAQLESLVETLRTEHEKALQVQRAALELELTQVREQARAAELGRTNIEAHHQTQLTEIADHAQGRIQKLETEVLKKRRGLKALTEENLQLQTELGELRRQLDVDGDIVEPGDAARLAMGRALEESPSALPSQSSEDKARLET